jgi:hypothetical protein
VRAAVAHIGNWQQIPSFASLRNAWEGGAIREEAMKRQAPTAVRRITSVMQLS